MSGPLSWSRRRFLREGSIAAAAVATGSMLAPSLVQSQALPTSVSAAVRASIASAPVLSFHLDQPYIDPTGEAREYRPPAGARGGAPLAALSDAELSRYYGFI